MLIFASDLHLADDPAQASFDEAAFLRELEACLAACPTGDRPRLVLLGDVFELLKSHRWLQAGVRPWHAVTPALSDVTTDILLAIVANYPRFFSALRELHASGRLDISYLPGNHDGLLADEAGGAARAALRGVLPLSGQGDAFFDENMADADHGVFAEHGHGFDDFNRPPGTSRLVPGDVVVIELVLRLPLAVEAQLLKLGHRHEPGADAALERLRELDNVLPQDGQGLLAWLRVVVQRAPDALRDALHEALMAGLNECLHEAGTQVKTHGALSRRSKALMSLLGGLVSAGGMASLKAAAAVQADAPSEVNLVASSARRIAGSQALGEQDTFVFVAGHTHLPLHHPVAVGGGRAITYLNSGTWRRVHLQVPQPDGSAAFVSYQEETLLCVHKRVGNAAPAYEFRRFVRGA